jgi:hypothetical protein
MVPHDQNLRRGCPSVKGCQQATTMLIRVYSVQYLQYKYSFCAWPAMEGAKVWSLCHGPMGPWECSKLFVQIQLIQVLLYIGTSLPPPASLEYFKGPCQVFLGAEKESP